MKKLLYRSEDRRLKFQVTDRKAYRLKVRNGSIIATLVAATPFLFYLYEYVPNTKVWVTPLFTYHSNYYESVSVAAWVIIMKFVPLLLVTIWFFTCKHWWYHALLIPISMFSFQVISALKEDFSLDALGIIYILPIMALIIPSIYIIRAQMFDKINNADKTMEELEAEFMIKPKTLMGKLKQYF